MALPYGKVGQTDSPLSFQWEGLVENAGKSEGTFRTLENTDLFSGSNLQIHLKNFYNLKNVWERYRKMFIMIISV